MPRDMTMERPHARIIRVELHHHISRGPVGGRGPEHLRIASCGITRVDCCAIPFTHTFTQHVHVVPVQVHRVGDWRQVVDNNPDTARVAHVVHIPLLWVLECRVRRGDEILCTEQGRVIVTGAEGRIVHGPEEITRRIEAEVDIDNHFLGRRVGRGDLVVWHGLAEVVVGADVGRMGPGRAVGLEVGVGVLIVHHRVGVWLVGQRAVADHRPHPDGIAGAAGGFDDDVRALTDAQGDDFRGVRLDGHKVVGHDGEFVVVDAEFLQTFSTGIDQPESVFLALCELELGVACVGCARGAVLDQVAVVCAFAVDQVVVGIWCHLGQIGAHDVFDEVVILAMVVVGQKNRAEILIIVGICRSVDNHGTEETSSVLSRVVSMIPRSAVKISKERISE